MSLVDPDWCIKILPSAANFFCCGVNSADSVIISFIFIFLVPYRCIDLFAFVKPALGTNLISPPGCANTYPSPPDVCASLDTGP